MNQQNLWLKMKKNGTPVSPAGGGMFLVSGGRDRAIKIWHVPTGQCVRTIGGPGLSDGHDGWVRAALFHPSGAYIVSCGDDKSIRVWDMTKNCKMTKHLLSAHSSFVSCIDWHSGCSMMASGGTDNILKLWNCR